MTTTTRGVVGEEVAFFDKVGLFMVVVVEEEGGDPGSLTSRGEV